MKTLHLLLIATLLFCTTIPAWASVELNAYLPISGYHVTPQFKFEKSYHIDYPNGGKLKDALAGRNLTITCSDDSSNNQSVKQLMEVVNNQISSSGSSVSLTNLAISYTFTLTGGQNSASMDYVIMMRPTITDYLLDRGGQDTPTTLDASWISFTIKDLVVIDTKKCGKIEINHPLSIIESVFPDVYSVILNTPGESIFAQAFNQNLIDSTPLTQQPLDK